MRGYADFRVSMGKVGIFRKGYRYAFFKNYDDSSSIDEKASTGVDCICSGPLADCPSGFDKSQVQNFKYRHRKLQISRCAASCFDDEAEQSSLPVDKLDPDLVVANRVACTKELEEVKKHPNKLVEILVKHIEAGAPSNVALPRNMARKPPTVIYRETKYGQFKDRK